MIKREKSIDEVFAYSKNTLDVENKNSFKSFLLFATKMHWKNDSKIEYIRSGLEWLVKNYQKEGIQSIALPALGCGLGKLSWENIGPLMCYCLNQLEIKSIVYLPMKKNIPKDQLTEVFLLQKKYNVKTSLTNKEDIFSNTLFN